MHSLRKVTILVAAGVLTALFGLALGARASLVSASPSSQGTTGSAADAVNPEPGPADLSVTTLQLDGLPYPIDVLSWSWGMQQGAHAGGGGGGTGKVTMNDISFTRKLDKSSPQLMLRCCDGNHYRGGHLTVRKAGGEQQEYLAVTMSDVTISSYAVGGAGDDRPTETLTLNFTKAAVQVTDDSTGEPETFNWQLTPPRCQ